MQELCEQIFRECTNCHKLGKPECGLLKPDEDRTKVKLKTCWVGLQDEEN